jgi:hypothetical protein
VGDDILWLLEGVPCVERTAFEQKVPSTIDLLKKIYGATRLVCVSVLHLYNQINLGWSK